MDGWIERSTLAGRGIWHFSFSRRRSLFLPASHQHQMSNPLSSHLHFASSSSSSRSPVPPAGSSLLVTDTLAASADFLLVHFLTAQLRRGKHVVFLACGEAEGHWKALAKKLVSLTIRFLLFLFAWDRVDPFASRSGVLGVLR